MALIQGKAIEQVSPAVEAGDGQFKIMGYNLKEWNEIIENIKSLMALRGGAPAAQIREHLPMEDNKRHETLPPIYQAAPSKTDTILRQIHGALKVVCDTPAADKTLFELLQSSGITVRQLYEQLDKAIK